MITTAVVLAGGLGTRLRSRVADRPKPMAPIAGRPFLEFLLDRLEDGGVRDVVLCVGHLGEMVQAHFGSRYRDLHLRYSVEQAPLGTGGALREALAHCVPGPALVLNGDTYLEMDFAEFGRSHVAGGSRISVVVREVDDVARYGSVELEGEVIRKFVEKGRDGRGWINAGTYAVNADLFAGDSLPIEAFSFETDFLAPRCTELDIRAFRTDGYLLDIGIPADFDRAQQELPDRHPRR